MKKLGISSVRKGSRQGAVLMLPVALALLSACRSPEGYREQADRAAYRIIESKQEEGLGQTGDFTIQPAIRELRERLLLDQNLPRSGDASLGTHALQTVPHWSDRDYLDESERTSAPGIVAPETALADGLVLSLNDSLRIAARNNREYQSRKEAVFLSALELDLRRDAFRPVFSGPVEASGAGRGTGDGNVLDAAQSAGLGVTQRFKQGAILTGAIAFDLTQLLTQEGSSSLGFLADSSIEVPLLRGSGRWIVTEPLTQAERNALYAIYDFERFKRVFAVDLASSYLGVLRQLDQVDNAEENYRRLVTSSRRAQALADEGRLPEIQVDQALQDELRARNGWISAQQAYAASLDAFKNQLGLPVDAAISLDRQTLKQLAEAVKAALPDFGALEVAESGSESVPAADDPIELEPPNEEGRGPLEMDPQAAILLALEHRLDLRIAEGGVFDAMRGVAVAADGFRPEFTLFAGGSVGESRPIGSAALEDASVRLDRGNYNALLRLDLPLERTAERNDYRSSLVTLEQAVRSLQALEDNIKLNIRNQLRDMLESRESLRIQAQAVKLAERRVDSTSLLLKLGRAEIRDVLEAQDALLSAQNALTSALVNYRVSELQLQANLGLLEVDANGLWREYSPATQRPRSS